MIYLDNAATTRVCEPAAKKALELMTINYGNPSSLHSFGLSAEKEVRQARQNIANALGCKASEIFFTSGGTESNNTAVFGAVKLLSRRGKRIITTAAEHASVLEPMKALEKQGFDVVYLKTPHGFPDIDELKAALTPDTILVSMMLVNNETGAIYPVEEAAKAIKAAKSIALLHCDCIQAFLKIPFSPITLGADLLSVSSHKIHGPKGCGALYVRSKLSLPPYLYGGMQESGLRSGTENTPGICGFGEAAKLGFAQFAENAAKLKTLKEYSQNNLKSAFSEIVINSPEHSSPHILNFSLPGYRSETILHYLESRGIYVSSGSACKKGAKSHVLACMALPDNLIDSAIRLSFSDENTTEDIDSLIYTLSEGVKTLQKK